VFLEAGGETLQYIPALNARPEHVKALAQIVRTGLEQPEPETPVLTVA